MHSYKHLNTVQYLAESQLFVSEYTLLRKLFTVVQLCKVINHPHEWCSMPEYANSPQIGKVPAWHLQFLVNFLGPKYKKGKQIDNDLNRRGQKPLIQATGNNSTFHTGSRYLRERTWNSSLLRILYSQYHSENIQILLFACHKRKCLWIQKNEGGGYVQWSTQPKKIHSNVMLSSDLQPDYVVARNITILWPTSFILPEMIYDEGSVYMWHYWYVWWCN